MICCHIKVSREVYQSGSFHLQQSNGYKEENLGAHSIPRDRKMHWKNASNA